jgi:hypothetical protein
VLPRTGDEIYAECDRYDPKQVAERHLLAEEQQANNIPRGGITKW